MIYLLLKAKSDKCQKRVLQGAAVHSSLADRLVTFSSLTSSELVDAGFSMATRLSICSRWFCITSLETEKRNTFIYKSCLIRISKSSQPLKGILMHRKCNLFLHTFFYFSLKLCIFIVLHTVHFHCMEHFVQALKMLCSTEENHTG